MAVKGVIRTGAFRCTSTTTGESLSEREEQHNVCHAQGSATWQLSMAEPDTPRTWRAPWPCPCWMMHLYITAGVKRTIHFATLARCLLFHVAKVSPVKILRLQEIQATARQHPPTAQRIMETNLFRLFILTVLHGVVNMAQHSFYRIRFCQVQWQEGNQRMILDLSA